MTDARVMVYDAYTALMIPGASVTLFEIMRGTSYSQVTDSSGVAYFYNLPSSRYSVSVNKSGYYESNHEEAVGGDYLEIDVALQPLTGPPPPIPEYTVTVAVTNQTGTPLSGITVQIAKVDGGYSNAGATGLNGSIVFTGVPTGTYGVYVNNGPMNTVVVDRDLTITFAIVPPPPPPVGWTVTIQVIQEGGSVVVGVPITLYGGSYGEEATSGNDGAAVFTGVPTGTYTAVATVSGVDYTKVFAVTGNTSQIITVPRQGGPTVTWEGSIPPFKDGTYKWSLRFNIVPIPFLDNYIVDWVAQRPQDEAALNAALQSRGIGGSATITNKEITKHTNILGNVDQFTITYTFTLTGTGLSLAGTQSLVVWVPILLAALPAILVLLTAVVYLLIVNSIVAGIKEVVGPGGKNVNALVLGGLGIAGLLLLTEQEKGKKS